MDLVSVEQGSLTQGCMNPALLAKVKVIVAQQFGVDVESVTPCANFRETLSADSLELVELIMAIARCLDLRDVIDEEMRQIETVEQLVSYLDTHQAVRV
jgi:acyl carrier protein